MIFTVCQGWCVTGPLRVIPCLHLPGGPTQPAKAGQCVWNCSKTEKKNCRFLWRQPPARTSAKQHTTAKSGHPATMPCHAHPSNRHLEPRAKHNKDHRLIDKKGIQCRTQQLLCQHCSADNTEVGAGLIMKRHQKHHAARGAGAVVPKHGHPPRRHNPAAAVAERTAEHQHRNKVPQAHKGACRPFGRPATPVSLWDSEEAAA